MEEWSSGFGRQQIKQAFAMPDGDEAKIGKRISDRETFATAAFPVSSCYSSISEPNPKNLAKISEK